MRVRFFGAPWPSEERRAPICSSDVWKVQVESVAGNRCIQCENVITERDRGVITACTSRIWGHFWLDLPGFEADGDHDGEPAGTYPVAAYHLLCWLKEVVGGEMSEKVASRMRLNPGDKPLTAEEIDMMEESGLSTGREEHEPGKGWFS